MWLPLPGTNNKYILQPTWRRFLVRGSRGWWGRQVARKLATWNWRWWPSSSSALTQQISVSASYCAWTIPNSRVRDLYFTPGLKHPLEENRKTFYWGEVITQLTRFLILLAVLPFLCTKVGCICTLFTKKSATAQNSPSHDPKHDPAS
jgi:large-conductance mechanosensitive channel